VSNLDRAGDAPLCLDCGACCHSGNAQLVELMGLDTVQVPSAHTQRAADGSQHMRMVADPAHDCLVCAAFGAGNACKIYEQRPFLCREFERGSAECLQAIADMSKKRSERTH
jgi:Fe-S-cluster containining protein